MAERMSPVMALSVSQAALAPMERILNQLPKGIVVSDVSLSVNDARRSDSDHEHGGFLVEVNIHVELAEDDMYIEWGLSHTTGDVDGMVTDANVKWYPHGKNHLQWDLPCPDLTFPDELLKLLDEIAAKQAQQIEDGGF